MRKMFLSATILGGALVSDGAIANAAPMADSGMTVYGNAPIGHLQPRAQQLSPRSRSEQAEQQQMSAFDARQQKFDQELDRQLNICRGC